MRTMILLDSFDFLSIKQANERESVGWPEKLRPVIY